MTMKRMGGAFVLMALSGALQANSDSLTLAGYARETVPGTAMSAAYLSIQNDGAAERQLRRVELVREGASAELHTTVKDGDVSRMRPLAYLKVPAGGKVEMAPGAVHLMLHGVHLRRGEALPLRLFFANGDEYEISVPVRGLTGKQHHHG
ncbi:copper chaperone PCu(A)C [Microbulbifer sp. 2201CG32-9]|uniref:copper chaperone PCu(A)C n=1 Tax=Microbulbifer sp. 2201CG32-9 TaxID=3232309 RepID=UPI00345BB052